MADDLDAEDLRLNTLNRFRKHSPRLLLEEYSHCEVPAGCGGVVMRWVDPETAIPVLIRVAAPDGREISLLMDGAEVSSGRVDLAPGPHVLGLALGRGEEDGTLLVSIVRALARDEPRDDRSLVLLLSGAGRWRLTETEPAPEWAGLDLDDSAWSTPTPLAATSGGDYFIERLRELGARALAVPRGCCWIRARFVVPPLSRPTSAALALPEPQT